MKKIAIIGPECTGKTALSKELATFFNCKWVPEYARTYIEKTGPRYTYEDVEHIASVQLNQINAAENDSNEFIFFDTELIITKVWFNLVFNKKPEWLDEAIRNSNFDLYLLCVPDIPWEPDPVRENGGENRNKLFAMYREQLQLYNFKYVEISGVGEIRHQNARILINKLSKQHGS